MTFVIAVVFGVIPMIVYPLFFYWMDRYEKEPLPLLGAAFLWGFIPAAIFSLISQLIFAIPFLLIDETGVAADLFGSVMAAPITEEFFKGLAVLLVFLLFRKEFDGVFDGLLYGAMVGFGFAAVENILYFLSFGPDFGLILLRAFVFGLNHAIYTSMIGIGFGFARHAKSPFVRFGAPLIGLLVAIGLHMLHNLSATLASTAPLFLVLALLNNWLGVLFLLVVMIVAINRERSWIVLHLQDEVAKETLTQTQYLTVYSPLKRFEVRMQALFQGGPALWWRVGRYFHVLTELAYKKHAFARRGERSASTEQIETLRLSAKSLGALVLSVLP